MCIRDRYSIFIDEQLCEITIDRQGDQFFYGFEVNSTADTPRNRQRKKIEKKHMIQSVAFLGTLVLLILSVVFGVNRWSQRSNWEDISAKLKKIGQETSARVLTADESQESFSNYFFMVNGKAYSIKTNFPTEKEVVLENGMPLEAGDEFIVTYVPNNPQLNKIDYNRPTEKQIQTYRERTIAKYLEYNPQKTTKYITCLVDVVFELKGISGLADLYFQKTSPTENPIHNTDTFGRLTRDVPFQEKVKNKCDL